MGVVRTEGRAHEVGARMGWGGIPPYSKREWESVYVGTPAHTYPAYKQGYREGWRQKRKGG